MSFLNTTANLKFRTPLPRAATFDSAIAIFRDHDTLIRGDPEFESYVKLEPPATATNPATEYYKVTNHMEALPKGLWDTKVSFNLQLTNFDNGVEFLVHAPLGLLQKTLWAIEKATPEEDAEWVLQESVELKCSRLLMGTVKGQIEANWPKVHKRFVTKLTGTET